jgi:LysM repeat protein
MSTPNPLVPQGTLPGKGKSHVRIAVFTILAIHVVLLGGLLILGCKKTEEPPLGADLASITNTFPPLSDLVQPTSEPNIPDATGFVAAPPAPDTQTVVAPTPAFVTPTPPPTTPEPTTAGTEHVVVKGDLFSTLAKKYGVTTRAIVEANPGVDARRLKIGQKLRIPAPAPAVASRGSNGSGVTSDGMKVYTVKSGDNLTKIASANGVNTKTLRSVNALRTDQLKVGQKLKIPLKNGAPPVEPVSHQPSPEAPGTSASAFPPAGT